MKTDKKIKKFQNILYTKFIRFILKRIKPETIIMFLAESKFISGEEASNLQYMKDKRIMILDIEVPGELKGCLDE
jgi:hypothetical protein